MKIECKICKYRIQDGTLPEHYKTHHPAAYAEYLKTNKGNIEDKINNTQLRNYNRRTHNGNRM